MTMSIGLFSCIYFGGVGSRLTGGNGFIFVSLQCGFLFW
jgi:hypothetical protein